MRILVCGGNGFIGNAIAERLTLAGHTVMRGVRHPEAAGGVAIDYSRDVDVEDWLPRLQGVDAVVNAVGIIVERRGQRFDQVHRRAPSALFAACAKAGVKRVLQISALGADRGDTLYFTTKRAADEALMSQPVEWQILRPALVYGANGASARFFRMLSSVPTFFLPGGGHQRLQPVHIDDVAEAALRLLDPDTKARQCIELVGPMEVEYRDMLRTYRSAMGFPPPMEISVPSAIVGLAANTLGRIPGAMLTPDTWRMLRAGNTGSPVAGAGLLGRVPRALVDFIRKSEASTLRQEALAAWRTPLLRIALAFVWITSGLVSAFVFPPDQSLRLLARVGLRGDIALAALYGSAFMDTALGVASAAWPGRRLWVAQMLVIVVYTAIIAVALPEFMVHPFGPITKNLPLLAILVVLYSEEKRR